MHQKKKFIGDTEFAKELKFLSNVIEILEKSNNETKGSSLVFKRNENNSWSDTFDKHHQIAKLPEDVSKLTKSQWEKISRYAELTPEFIIKHIDKLNKDVIVRFQPINDEILEKCFMPLNMDILDKLTLNYDKRLTTKFYEKYFDEIYELSPVGLKFLFHHSLYQNLISAKYLNENWDKIKQLYKNQRDFLSILPVNFVQEHLSEFNILNVIQNVKLPKPLFDKIIFQIEQLIKNNKNNEFNDVEFKLCSDIHSPNVKYINEKFILQHPLIFNDDLLFASGTVKMSEKFLIDNIKLFGPEAVENLLNNQSRYKL